MAQEFDPYLHWLRIPPTERPASYYRLLGLAPSEASSHKIELAADVRMSQIKAHLDGPRAESATRLLQELDAAKNCLCSPAKRAAYDQSLLASSAQSASIGGASPTDRQPQAAALTSNFGFIDDTAPPIRRAENAARGGTPLVLTFGVCLLGALVVSAITYSAGLWKLSPAGTAEDKPQGEPVSSAATKTTTKSPATDRTAHSTPSAARINDWSPRNKPQRGAEKTEKPLPSEARSAEHAEKNNDPQLARFDIDARALDEGGPRENAVLAPKKFAMPEDAVQKAAWQEVRKLFEIELSAARKPEQKLPLAEKLQKLASDAANPPPTIYVLLNESRKLAAEAGDAKLALQACERLARSFEIDGEALQADALDVASRAVRTPTAREPIGKMAFELVDSAVQQDRYEIADKLLATAQFSLARSSDAALRKDLRARWDIVKRQRRRWEEAQQAAVTLKENSSDPAANLVLGKYMCFVKGDWPGGLPHLVKGNDAELARVAKLDLAGRNNPAKQLAIADAWFDYARVAPSDTKDSGEQTATFWYRSALPHLGAIEKTKAESRLESLLEGKDARIKIIGLYEVDQVDPKGGGHLVTLLSFQPTGIALEKGREIGDWEAQGDQVVLRYTDAASGKAVIKHDSKDALSAVQSMEKGQTWFWKMRRLRAVGVWEHSEGEDPPRRLTFYSNGMIDEDGKANWVLKGNQLTIQWPGGVVESCKLAPDRRSYAGASQNGVKVTGRLVAIKPVK